YDGNPQDKEVKPLRPEADLTKDIKNMMDKVPDSGALLIGQKGILFSPSDYGERFFVKLNDEKELVNYTEHEALKSIPVTLPRNTLASDMVAKQHLEWIAACKG